MKASELMIGLTVGLFGLAAAAVLVDVLTGGSLGLTSARPLPPSATPIDISIGTDRLRVPANLIRFPDQRRPGPRQRLDLALRLPDLSDASTEAPPGLRTTTSTADLIFVTFAARDTELDTADRIATIYQKFLEDGTSEGPDGLVRQPFRPGSSYAGEHLYFEPGSVHPFAARCFPLDKGQPPVTCLIDRKVGGHLMATLRLPIAALADWRTLQTRTDDLFDRLLVK